MWEVTSDVYSNITKIVTIAGKVASEDKHTHFVLLVQTRNVVKKNRLPHLGYNLDSQNARNADSSNTPSHTMLHMYSDIYIVVCTVFLTYSIMKMLFSTLINE